MNQESSCWRRHNIEDHTLHIFAIYIINTIQVAHQLYSLFTCKFYSHICIVTHADTFLQVTTIGLLQYMLLFSSIFCCSQCSAVDGWTMDRLCAYEIIIENLTFIIKCFMRCLVCPAVCPSVCFTHNSRTIRRRMMKLCTVILEVKSNMEFEDGSRTWLLTRSNWTFS